MSSHMGNPYLRTYKPLFTAPPKKPLLAHACMSSFFPCTFGYPQPQPTCPQLQHIKSHSLLFPDMRVRTPPGASSPAAASASSSARPTAAAPTTSTRAPSAAREECTVPCLRRSARRSKTWVRKLSIDMPN